VHDRVLWDSDGKCPGGQARMTYPKPLLRDTGFTSITDISKCIQIERNGDQCYDDRPDDLSTEDFRPNPSMCVCMYECMYICMHVCMYV